MRSGNFGSEEKGSSDFEKLNSMTDADLVNASRGDDPMLSRHAVSVLISRYLRLVRKKAYGLAGDRAEPEDLAQEGLLAFLNAVNSFDPNRGAKFSSFAEVCITNGIRSAVLRLGKYGDESPVEDFPESGSEDESPENIWFEKEKMFALYDEIESLLSKKEWSIFRLYLGGLSYREIADILDIPLKSVDNAVFRVRKKLKALLSQENHGV